jgi:molybdopterin molybdotransferase
MITFEEALNIVLKEVSVTESERIELNDSMGRILREDVMSDIQMPPFNKSAMDGFACRRKDLNDPLVILETIAAGKSPGKKVGRGECSRIMTGAMVPDGADMVVKVEDTKIDDEGRVLVVNPQGKSNIALKAEDVRAGDTVIWTGRKIEPQHIAIMAAVGWTDPLVSKKPRIGVISTGDEIVEPEEKPGITQIRNSNGHQLVAQALRAGAIANYLGIARDNEEDTFKKLKTAFDDNDIVILSGGVSMGLFDFIPGVLERLGVEISFSKVSIQPGKPTVFGKLEDKTIFGLPGNPVSSYTTFELFVRPLINKKLGLDPPYRNLALPLGVDYQRKKAERMSWIPVRLSSGGQVMPIEYHGSAHIFALADADMIAAVPAGIKKLEKGSLVDVRQV